MARPKAQEEARARAEEGDFEAARKLLADASDELRKRAPSSPRAAELLEEAETLEQRSHRMSPAAYDRPTSKEMHYGVRDLRRRPRREP